MTVRGGEDESWDVVVVGAGPAGATAARFAALGGARVLLLDKAVFPRYKTCGGGIIGESRRRLSEHALATIEEDVAEVGMSLRFGDLRHVRDDRPSVAAPFMATPFIAMVQRERFDQANVDAAVEAGATFRDGTMVRSLQQQEDGVSVGFADGPTLHARVVIGADGAGGRVGRYVGAQAARTDFGLEAELPRPAAYTDDAVLLDWGAHPGTYAWVFPKRDLLTVGVIERHGHGDRTRDYLDAWMTHLGLAVGPGDRSSGHLTQWRTADSPLRRGDVLLAGETAGLLEPWTREGISFALRSGEWAGAAAGDMVAGDRTAPARYERRVWAELVPEIEAGARLLRVFERHPGVVHRLLTRIPAGRRLFVAFCRGDASLAGMVRHRRVRGLTALLR
jgi:geranylgeranyl reductase family protein